MGLDMYLNRKSGKYKLDDGTYSNGFDRPFKEYCRSDEFGRTNHITIEENVGYWRKANAIHKWFVDNVQDGKDDCQDYHVEIDKLKELRDLCMSIVKKMDGKVFKLNAENKEFYDKKNAEAKEKGEKKPYDYAPTLKFNAKRLKDMWRKFGPYDIDDEDIVGYCKEKLPTTDGFFFGSTTYHGWYVQDVIKTILMLNDVISRYNKDRKNKDYYDFHYHASW